SISYLFYASRLLEFPLGIFVFAIGTAVLPSLSSLAAEGKQSELKETFVFALRLAMFIVIPAMIGLVVLRIPIINLLFERGSFTPHDTIQTSAALFYYALGLWAIAGVRVTVPLFYSLHDAKTPVLVGIMTVVANILFSLLLMGPLQHGGLALATTLASAVNLFFLLLLLRRKIGPLGIKATLGSVARALLSSLAMGLVAHAVCFHIDWTTPGMTITKILYLGSAVGGGVGAYFGLAFLLRFPELTYLKYIFRKKPSGPVRD
ncbi:MAG: polysaccharide biosynthesis C-terminal domain-containing protein, partial [Deltaproteobacteria bacterium]|nr:polysaccharide biosynthesis C-terminal domain-containing protein [Deltaproteobacteria bacterium]